MDISDHIVFTQRENPELFEYLKAGKIAYTDTGGLISFDMLQSDPRREAIKRLANAQKLFVLSESVFSEEERRQAQWLKMRSCWRVGYPQPEMDFKFETVTYEYDNHCSKCGCGLKQIAPFRMKKQPRWGLRHFMMLNWVGDELFVDREAKKILEESAVSGISFDEVRNKGGSAILPDIYQLVIRDFLKEGLVPEQSPLRETLVCDMCERIGYHPHGVGKYTYRKEIFEGASDIVKTSEVFGWGHSFNRHILIRQNVYRLLLENGLARGMEFLPVELV